MLTTEQQNKLNLFKEHNPSYQLDNDGFLWVWLESSNRYLCFGSDGNLLTKGEGDPKEKYADKFTEKLVKKESKKFTWFRYGYHFFQKLEKNGKTIYQDIHGKKVNKKLAFDFDLYLISFTKFYSYEEVVQELTQSSMV